MSEKPQLRRYDHYDREGSFMYSEWIMPAETIRAVPTDYQKMRAALHQEDE